MPRMKPSDRALLKQQNEMFDRLRSTRRTSVKEGTIGLNPTKAPSTSLKTFDSKGKKV